LKIILPQKLEKTEKFVCIKDLRFICNSPAMLKDKILNELGINRSETSSGKLEILKSILEI
jgi:hypothetical protein